MTVCITHLVGSNTYIGKTNDFGSADNFVLHVGARVFGCLAKVSCPLVEHYHSDLFHDAMRIREMIGGWNQKDSLRFAWSVDDCGTDFGLHRKYGFDCLLFVDDGTMRFYMTPVS